MTQILLETALLPTGWQHEVLVDFDEHGDITTITPNAKSDTAVRIRGCTLAGMTNVHSHAHQRAMAGLAERSGTGDDSFWTWREVMYRYVARMQPEQLEAVAAELYLEMLLAGYTSVAEFQYLHHDPDGTAYDEIAEMSLRTLEAARLTGIGMTSLPVLYRYGGFGSQQPHAGQERFINDAEPFMRVVESLRDASQSRSLERVGMAPHSPRAIDTELLRTVLDAFVAGSSAPVHIHIAEQAKEVADCLAWCGRRPVNWLLDEFDVDEHWCLIHATHMDHGEVERLARSGAVAGLCPTTEANLGDGLFAAPHYFSSGGVFAIGSDSHVSISPVEELRWLEYGQRLKHQGRNVLAGGPQRSTGRHLYEAALEGGSKACGRKVGRLEAGYSADFISLDTDHVNLYGKSGDDLLNAWIFSGNSNPIRDVFVGGQQVVADGEHAHAEKIQRRFKLVIDELSR